MNMQKFITHITAQTNLSEQQAWWLLESITEKNRSQLQFSLDLLTVKQHQTLEMYIKQLAHDHKPLAYILGWVPFLDLKIKVMPPTLIPRLETEFWVAELIDTLKKLKPDNIRVLDIGTGSGFLLRQDYGGQGINLESLTILDIGTGSGCIALSLAQAFPSAQIYAVDIAQSALDLAQENATLNNISNVTFVQSNLFEQLSADLKFDLIVSNPPYIDPIAQLEPSVNNWEDHGALFAPNHGLQIIEQIIAQAPKWLKKNNELGNITIPRLIIEIDASQGYAVKKLAENYGFDGVAIKKDQFDRDRTLWATFKVI